MNGYVIDASVAVKWVITETQQEEALRYLQVDIPKLAPSFFLVECANAIHNHVRLGKYSISEGWQAFETIHYY